jgi:hypothetical protein
VNPVEPTVVNGVGLLPLVSAPARVYALPFKQNILVKGWQMSGGVTAQSGSPGT